MKIEKVSFIKFLAKSLLLLSLGLPCLLVAKPNMNSALGYWNTVDDKTGKVLSVVHFYQQQENPTFSGKIAKICQIEGQKSHDKCIQCKGLEHNKPILGLRIIYGMSLTDPQKLLWENGRALDPKSGSVYRAKMWLTDGGKKLHLRGYIGFSLFGRTEIWHRASSNKKTWCQK
jgi:uncharacterized protein (DUF2147 family)